MKKKLLSWSLLSILTALSVSALNQAEAYNTQQSDIEGTKLTQNLTDTQGFSTTRDGLQYKDAVVGQGQQPRRGQTVVVHYTGWLTNGQKFDSSVDRGQPFDFVLGEGKVIRGWDEGLSTMKVGGKRRLIIPPQLGYGSSGAGGVIPPNATLVFDVELLAVR